MTKTEIFKKIIKTDFNFSGRVCIDSRMLEKEKEALIESINEIPSIISKIKNRKR